MIAMLNSKDKLSTPVATIPRVRHTRLARTLQDLRRRFGDGSIMQLGETVNPNVSVISTGLPELDEALGVGGLPRGKMVEICGPKSSGKTALCLNVIAECQKAGGVCAFIDMEHTLDLEEVTHYGVNADDLYLAQPSTGKEALAIAKALMQAGAEVVIIDSATSLMARAKLEGDIRNQPASLRIRLINQTLHKLSSLAQDTGAVLIFTTHLRLKPDFICDGGEFPSDGMALRFYSAVRIALSRTQDVASDGNVTNTRIRAIIKKNKVAPPYRLAEFDIG